jgi:hypothetical protein
MPRAENTAANVRPCGAAALGEVAALTQAGHDALAGDPSTSAAAAQPLLRAHQVIDPGEHLFGQQAGVLDHTWMLADLCCTQPYHLVRRRACCNLLDGPGRDHTARCCRLSSRDIRGQARGTPERHQRPRQPRQPCPGCGQSETPASP